MRTLVVFLLLVSSCFGASHRTANFIVECPTADNAKSLADWAEAYRKSLSLEWFGVELPQWNQPCQVSVTFAQGNGGMTTFVFEGGEVYGWKMQIQGQHPKLTESVLQHEVMHTVLATHFRQALPRWLDEGICMNVENPSSMALEYQMFIQALGAGKQFPIDNILMTKNYPQQIGIFYGQSASIVKFLRIHYPDGEKHLVEFTRSYLMYGSWEKALRDIYSYKNIAEFEEAWTAWVRVGELEPQEHVSAKWVKQCSPGGGCTWIWVPFWSGTPNQSKPHLTIPSQPGTQAPVPDYVPPTVGTTTPGVAPPVVSVNPQLEARVQSLENSRDAFGKALNDLSASNVLVHDTINKYHENMTEIETKVVEQDKKVEAVEEKHESLLKKILGRIKGKVDITDDESVEDDTGEKSGWTRVGELVPVVGGWFGLPTFGLIALSQVLKFIGRRKEGRSKEPFPKT